MKTSKLTVKIKQGERIKFISWKSRNH